MLFTTIVCQIKFFVFFVQLIGRNGGPGIDCKVVGRCPIFHDHQLECGSVVDMTSFHFPNPYPLGHR